MIDSPKLESVILCTEGLGKGCFISSMNEKKKNFSQYEVLGCIEFVDDCISDILYSEYAEHMEDNVRPKVNKMSKAFKFKIDYSELLDLHENPN